MGNGFPLTDQQWDELDKLRFSTASADVYRNCLIILMTSQRWTIPATAKFVGCGTDTVKRIRRQYRQHGLAGLIPGHSPGRPSEATPEFLQHLRTAVQTQPLTLGYGFTTWSVPRLAAHLAKQTGIRFSVTHLRRLLHQAGFSVHRPKHTMKGKRDEVAYGKAKKRLQRLKKKALKPDATEALVFQDEVEIHLHPALSRMWALVGQQPEVPAPGKNEKRVVYGGINYVTAKTTYTIAGSKSGVNFLAYLQALVKAYAGRKVRLVCDNGRFHHTKAVRQWLKANRHRLEIFWLPPYSPSLNLIERLWGHLKRTVLANVLFQNLDDLEAAFRKGMARLNGRRDRMDFIFNHDDLLRRTG